MIIHRVLAVINAPQLVQITDKTINMTWNTMTPEERVTHLIDRFRSSGCGAFTEYESLCASRVFAQETLSMLPAASENEKEISYWEEVQELLNNY